LVTVFLSTFPTGTSSLAFCLDEQENHVVGKNLNLVNCHSTKETVQIFYDEHYSTLFGKRENGCTDVSLNNAKSLNRPSRKTLPISAKVALPPKNFASLWLISARG